MNGKTAARPGTKGLGQIVGGTRAGTIGEAAAMPGRVSGKSKTVTAAAAATPGRVNGESKTGTAAVTTGRVTMTMTMTGAEAAATMVTIVKR